MSATHTLSIRKRLLHILLWCLAASAASGVLTVLVSDRDIMGRVTAMGFVGAAAIALMIPMSLLADRPKRRAAGLFGMCACIGAFLIASGLIWTDLTGWQREAQFGLTLVLVIFMSPAVVGLLCLRSMDNGRIAGLVGLACAALASVFFLTGIWLDDVFFEESLTFGTGFAITWTGLPASLCLIGFGRDRWYWRWLGIGGAVAALAFWLNGIWFRLDGSPAFVVCPLSIAAVVAFTNIMLRSTLRGGQRMVVYGTIAAAAGTALFVDLNAIMDDPYVYGDPYGFQRFTAGASIVTISGTLAVIVLTMLNRRAMRKATYAARTIGTTDGEPGAELSRITLHCPRCQKEQTLPLGESACIDCRLVIKTTVEVPVCPQCGYDVSMIKADKCPECGATL